MITSSRKQQQLWCAAHARSILHPVLPSIPPHVCGFETECNVHHCPHYLLPGWVEHSTFARVIFRIRPPEVECACCVRGCIWNCSHRTWHFGECGVPPKWSGELVDEVVGCPDSCVVGKWDFVQLSCIWLGCASRCSCRLDQQGGQRAASLENICLDAGD